MPNFQFDSFSDFLAMGNYGLYVWSAYAFFTVIVVYNLIQPKLVRKRFMKQQKARLRREEARNTQL